MPIGLQSDLNIPPVNPNVFQRTIQRMADSGVGVALFSRTIGPIDRLTHKVTGGRTTLGRAFGGFPVVMLLTIGARTGQERINPVTAIPYREDLALVGTNFGRDRSPGWAHNLLARPEATLTFGERRVAMRATEAAGDDYEGVFEAALSVYPGYARYRRSTDRVIPIFILTNQEPE